MFNRSPNPAARAHKHGTPPPHSEPGEPNQMEYPAVRPRWVHTDLLLVVRAKAADRCRKLPMHQLTSRACTCLVGALLFMLTPHTREDGSDAEAIWSDQQAAIDHINAEQPDHPLAHLAHLHRGEWRTTPANGIQQRDVWTWGPSRQALTSVTSNSKATSQAVFGSFRVIYHHPQRNEIVVLALFAPHLIQTGTLTPLDGLNTHFDMTLYYDLKHFSWIPEPTRKISSVWTFDTPTSYTNHWIEDQGQPVDPSTTGWSYTWHEDVTPLPPTATEPPEHIKHLTAFIPLLKSEWRTDTTLTTFAWIPYNEAILMRTIDTRTNKQTSETIFYPHPHTKTIHTIAIHDSASIDEGTAKTDGDAIVILAERADDTTTTRIEQRIEHPNARTIRIQTWSISGTDRTLLIETTHQARAD